MGGARQARPALILISSAGGMLRVERLRNLGTGSPLLPDNLAGLSGARLRDGAVMRRARPLPREQGLLTIILQSCHSHLYVP
jgi:hypothetical protein